MQEIKITIPTSLDDISLRDYLSFISIGEDVSDDTKERIALQKFCKIPFTLTNKITASQRKDLLAKLGVALNVQPDFRPTFKHNGIDYGFEPSLEDMTFGQFVDIDAVKDYQKDLPKLLAILYRPITKRVANTYEIKPYTGNEEFQHIEQWPASIGAGALLFFWTIGKHCLNATQSYIQIADKQKQNGDTSERSGAGTATSTASRKMILEDLKKLSDYLTTGYCFGLPMKLTLPLHINNNHNDLTPKPCTIPFQI